MGLTYFVPTVESDFSGKEKFKKIKLGSSLKNFLAV